MSIHNRITLLGFSLFSVFITSCEHHLTERASNNEERVEDWSYSGETSPEHWADFELNSDCDGMHQSPVNIIDYLTVEPEDTRKLNLYYSPDIHLRKASNNGYTIQFDFMTGDSIVYSGNSYQLVQIHFHEHSEHLISGVLYPVEIHLVHTDGDGGLCVLAVLGKEGEESQIFRLLESFLPLEMGESKAIDVNCDLNQLLPDDRTFYSYTGSLTTPPCTEGVEWIVFKEPIVLSVDEVEKLRENMPLNNYRDQQPLNGRVVNLNS